MTHPVEGLKPGPLAGQDLSLLKEGISVLREKYWGLMRFDRFDDSERRAFLTDLSDGEVRLHVPADMEYIGEQDAQGWIAWTGGENPVPGMMVDVRYRGGDSIRTEPYFRPWEMHEQESETLRWQSFDNDNDIIAFRPVSTKPQGGVEEENECGCADRAPRDRDWTCPDCDADWPAEDTGDQGALQAQAPSVTSEQADGAVVAALQGALEWDKARGYRMPYRVRDPIYAALDAIAKGGAS